MAKQLTKRGDQFTYKPNAEETDLYVFFDTLSQTMARMSHVEFLAWLRDRLEFAALEHGHSIQDIEFLASTLSSYSGDIQQLKNEVLELLDLVSKPPAKPTNVDWIQEPAVGLDPVVLNQVNVGAGSASWYGETINYLAHTFASLGNTSEGRIRVDVVVAEIDGSIAYIDGKEGVAGARPPIPAGSLWLRDVIWKADGVSTETPTAINFDYSSYTGKDTPADSAVFLVQESSGTKFKWTLMQLVAWLEVKTFSSITENEYGIHPAFTDQHSFNVWMLQNRGSNTSTPVAKPVTNAAAEALDNQRIKYTAKAPI